MSSEGLTGLLKEPLPINFAQVVVGRRSPCHVALSITLLTTFSRVGLPRGRAQGRHSDFYDLVFEVTQSLPLYLFIRIELLSPVHPQVQGNEALPF